MLVAAPAVALIAGIAAEWLDFQALRYPLLGAVLAGVTVTAAALDPGRRQPALGQALRTVALGVATWGAAEAVYVIIHTLRGEPFDAGRFGPQPAQALGLIAVHALALGAPTGAVAAALLRLRAWWLARA
jgi:hypothetical protein